MVAVSQGLAKDAEQLYPPVRSRLHVLPNGIDVARVQRSVAPDQPRPYALYAGRLARAKSVPRIIEGFAPVAAVEPGVDLLIAGSGDREAECRQAVERGWACPTEPCFWAAVPAMRFLGSSKGLDS